MTIKLTPRSTVELTRELWMWMVSELKKAINDLDYPSPEKEYWPEWERYGRMQNDCPCCEYVSQLKESGCNSCPLFGYWTNTLCSRCEDVGSPYLDWLNFTHILDKFEAAEEIVDICDKWLEDHKE